MKAIFKVAATGAVVLVAAGLIAYKYRDYIVNPWTRDGQVRAIVIQMTPRVSGPVVDLPIKDNQFVKAGDLLFEIDPRTYKATLDEATAKLDETRDQLQALEQEVKAARAEVDQTASIIEEARSNVESMQSEYVRTKTDLARAAALLERGNVSKRRYDQAKTDYDVARANLQKARSELRQEIAAKSQAEAQLARARFDRGAPGEDNARLRAAVATMESAQLDLNFTRVTAPVDGYVTNLNLRLGSQAVANQPALALVDVNSFWLDGYFRETFVGRMTPGDRAVVTLMTYPDTPIEGVVDSLGWGIAQEDGSTGTDLLPVVNPTFEWIRLAQRIPVRIHLTEVPESVELRVGATASILVKTGERGKTGGAVPAAPKALQ
jgi:multidrug resistance efflux pump